MCQTHRYPLFNAPLSLTDLKILSGDRRTRRRGRYNLEVVFRDEYGAAVAAAAAGATAVSTSVSHLVMQISRYVSR